MSDQQEPVEAQEATPDPGTPTTESVDAFEQRYNELRPQYDRTQNELHRYQNDPEFRSQLFQELAAENGYELEAEQEPEYDDPYEKTAAELAELRAWKESFVEQQAIQEQAAIAKQYSENKMTEFGIPDSTDRNLPEDERELAGMQRDWIVTRAMALPAIQDQQGNLVPDIDTAYKEFRRMVPEAPQARPEAPFTPQGGQENTGVPAWSDNPIERRAQREALMLQALERSRAE